MNPRLLFLGALCCSPIFTDRVHADNYTASYLVCVSNEKSDDVTLIDGANHSVIATIPVGKRPRGIHGNADGSLLYVALSGSPMLGPRHLRQGEVDLDSPPPDREADGIGIIDLQHRQFIRKFQVGPDPEEFAISADGSRVYVSNEDSAKVSVVTIEEGIIEHVIPVREEPEGVALSPDGAFVYVTCETDGEIFVIDTATHTVAAEFVVGGRPRTVGFLPDGSRAFIPSENSGIIHVIDTREYTPLKTFSLPTNSRPMGIAVTGDGSRVLVSTGWGGSVCVLDSENGDILHEVKVGSRPWGIALSPDNSRLYVANGPSNDISVVDVNAGRELRRIPAGTSPWGVAIVNRVQQ